ncbi:MAG: hypothetical protein ACPGYT_08925, partial [Nitrospirales bacterium]
DKTLERLRKKVFAMPYTVRQTVWLYSISGIICIMTSVHNPVVAHAKNSSIKTGHVTGTITAVGKLPQIRKFNLATYPDPYYCGRVSDGRGWRIAPKPSITKDSHFAGAIIFIKGLKSDGQRQRQTHSLKTLNCRFNPFIGLLKTGDSLVFENWDPILHPIEVFQATLYGGRLLFSENLHPHSKSVKSDFLLEGEGGIHQPGPAREYEVRDDGVLFIRCPLHEYMEAWALSLSHDYFSPSDEDGVFSITDIPAGTHTLVVWHPIGRTEVTVNIREQQTLNLNIKFQPSRSTFYREPEIQTNPFGIELLGDSKIIPSVELQKE